MAQESFDHKTLTKAIINIIGFSNITDVRYCATSIQIKPKRYLEEIKNELKLLPGVLTVVNSDQSYYIVVGKKTKSIYNDFREELNLKEADLDSSKTGLFSRLFSNIASVLKNDGKEDLKYEQNVKILDKERKIDTAKLQKELEKEHTIIEAPLPGKVISLSQINDEIFASGVMGKGAAIIPENGKVYAPVSGKISLVFDTKHAIGITTEDGKELLIHFGIDTVNMGGKGFKVYVEENALVNKGDLILEVDLNEVKKAHCSPVTPVLITNADKYSDVLEFPSDSVQLGDNLIAVIK